MEISQQIQLEARKELARRYFYDYCKLRLTRGCPGSRGT